MSSGNNQINLVATRMPVGGGAGTTSLRGTFGAFLWRGFQSGAETLSNAPRTNQFFQ